MTTLTIHVLRRRNWRFAGDHLVLLPGHVRLQSYADADEAAGECRERNRTIRARINPFRCAGPALRNQTGLDAGRLHDWALDQGVTPPEGDDWAAWWDAHSPKMTELQREGMWQALDRLSFYEVVEQPERPVVYVAVAVNWQYNDQWFVADGEGGQAQFAFRTRKEAEEYAEEANKLQRETWEDAALAEDPDEGRAFDMGYRRQSLEDVDSPLRDPHAPNATADEVDFVEIIEVEWEGCAVPPKKKLYFVQRLAWCMDLNEDSGRGVCHQHESPEGLPVRAFATKAEATKVAKQLTGEARKELNPFQFADEDLEAIMHDDEIFLFNAVAEQGLPTPDLAPTRSDRAILDWLRWYDELADTLADAERDAIWNRLGRLELYRVVEVDFF